MAKKIKNVQKFLPFVSMEDILAYDSAKPETRTASRLVNAVCELLEDKTILAGGHIAEHLGMDSRHLTCTLEVVTGHSTADIRAEIMAKHYREYIRQNPKFKVGELACALGFSDHTSLWKFVERNKSRFPELYREDEERKGRLSKIVEQIMPNESIRVRRLYILLPIAGGQKEEEPCLRLLYHHARKVADLALSIAKRHPELNLDPHDVEECALLHNVGIVWTNSPELHCHGKYPYQCHGEMSFRFLSKHAGSQPAFVGGSHIGTGIEHDKALAIQELLLGYTMPKHPIELLISYVTCLISIRQPDHIRTTPEARAHLSQFGPAAIERFDKMTQLFA